jgi:glycosyltransferase involved in cell wall biosynthesis
MKILLVHSEYQQRGGEETIFEQEKKLLCEFGHEVLTYYRRNHEIEEYSRLRRMGMAASTIWSERTRKDVAEILRGEKPDVVHVHNTFVMVSPSVYWACREANVPVVQTLHNYRLFCPSGYFLRDGKICEDCLAGGLWPSIRHACYRGSHTQSAVIAATLGFHRWKGTWSKQIDAYLALTRFAQRKFIAAGLPADKVFVKPNFIHPDPRKRTGAGEYAIYVGRLLAEKGPLLLLDAWERLQNRIPLVICGDGPLYVSMRQQAQERGLSSIEFKGRLSRNATLEAMKKARFLILPSQSYEGFPMTIAEAYACGVPAIATAVGALLEIVEESRTGITFRRGDAVDLAGKVEWAWSNPEKMQVMGDQARRTYEEQYTGAINYRKLIAIYEKVIGRSNRILQAVDGIPAAAAKRQMAS